MKEQVPLLHVRDLRVTFHTYRGPLRVLDGVELKLKAGERLGLVGETGAGKTTTLKAILRILPEGQAKIDTGEILFKGKDVLKFSSAQLQELRRRNLAMIFQDPTAALNPVFTVGHQLRDVIKYGHDRTKRDTRALQDVAIRALRDVSLTDPPRLLHTYPIQLSGGMRQRVCISMAMAIPPELLIADEPGTSLDVTIQDQILRLIQRMVETRGSSTILVTHSLGVVREMTDRVSVMYGGNVVEETSTKKLFSKPLHPYTEALMSCVPRLTGEGISAGIPGRMPDYLRPPTGCRFHPRCPHAMAICRQAKPRLAQVEPDRRVACFLYHNEQD